jgi:hypothetical protein
VVIVGQGANSWHIRNSSFIAAALAERGMASVAINYAGQGYGPESTVILTDKSGARTEVPAAGRAADGSSAGPEPGITSMRDSLRQTVVYMMQLIRVIKAGADLNGDGINDLNGDRVYFAGCRSELDRRGAARRRTGPRAAVLRQRRRLSTKPLGEERLGPRPDERPQAVATQRRKQL